MNRKKILSLAIVSTTVFSVGFSSVAPYYAALADAENQANSYLGANEAASQVKVKNASGQLGAATAATIMTTAGLTENDILNCVVVLNGTVTGLNMSNLTDTSATGGKTKEQKKEALKQILNESEINYVNNKDGTFAFSDKAEIGEDRFLDMVTALYNAYQTETASQNTTTGGNDFTSGKTSPPPVTAKPDDNVNNNQTANTLAVKPGVNTTVDMLAAANTAKEKNVTTVVLVTQGYADGDSGSSSYTINAAEVQQAVVAKTDLIEAAIGNFNPNDTMTKQEAAEVVAKLLTEDVVAEDQARAVEVRKLVNETITKDGLATMFVSEAIAFDTAVALVSATDYSYAATAATTPVSLPVDGTTVGGVPTLTTLKALEPLKLYTYVGGGTWDMKDGVVIDFKQPEDINLGYDVTATVCLGLDKANKEFDAAFLRKGKPLGPKNRIKTDDKGRVIIKEQGYMLDVQLTPVS